LAKYLTIKCGTISVIQPIDNVSDKEILGTATENNLSMIFTGVRHFKH